MITDARGESVFRSYSLWGLAVAVWRRGERERAVQLLEQALQADLEVNDRLNASMCLQALAWIAAQDRNARRAVVLLAASEKLSRSVGSPTVVVPNMSGYQQACEHATRDALDKEAFAAAQRYGTGLSFGAAIAYALGEQPPATSSPAAPAIRLTKREREVAELIAEGLTNKEIATRLVISPRTAQGHVEHLLTKLGSTSRTQIAAWVVETRTEDS